MPQVSKIVEHLRAKAESIKGAGSENRNRCICEDLADIIEKKIQPGTIDVNDKVLMSHVNASFIPKKYRDVNFVDVINGVLKDV